MVITNHQIVDGPQEDNRRKIASSSTLIIDGAICGGDLLLLIKTARRFPYVYYEDEPGRRPSFKYQSMFVVIHPP